jgi:hypothetical protein
MKTKKNTKTTSEQAVMQHWNDALGHALCGSNPDWGYIKELVAHLQKAADEGLNPGFSSPAGSMGRLAEYLAR